MVHKTTQSRGLTKLRLISVLAGGLPVIFWIPLVAFWETVSVAGTLDSIIRLHLTDSLGGMVLVVWGLLGLWGAYAIWAAAIGPNPVDRWTAFGLGAGILAIAPLAVPIWLDASQTGSIAITALIVTWGPIAVAAIHIWIFKNRVRQ